MLKISMIDLYWKGRKGIRVIQSQRSNIKSNKIIEDSKKMGIGEMIKQNKKTIIRNDDNAKLTQPFLFWLWF